MRKVSALLVVFALARLGHAEWNVTATKYEPASAHGIEHCHIVLENNGEHAALDLVLFSAKTARLRVIDNAGGAASLSDTMQREKCVAGVNGGYFDTESKPLGLRIIDGAGTSPLIRARLLTAVLCASPRGIEIMRAGEFSRERKYEAALQCGPLLVERGRWVASLNGVRSARRTFAATLRGGRAAIGISTDLTLAELSAVLTSRSLADDLPFWRAMNLDGGSSSAFWFQRSDGSVLSISEDKPVRDFIGLEPE
ncbi:MAG: phosphodiester glycosidase family protein [Verrucomicrobia bacterium]|nr:phosphodiester glycosidase family protein [Verrucomicrobiota bacterium]